MGQFAIVQAEVEEQLDDLDALQLDGAQFAELVGALEGEGVDVVIEHARFAVDGAAGAEEGEVWGDDFVESLVFEDVDVFEDVLVDLQAELGGEGQDRECGGDGGVGDGGGGCVEEG